MKAKVSTVTRSGGDLRRKSWKHISVNVLFTEEPRETVSVSPNLCDFYMTKHLKEHAEELHCGTQCCDQGSVQCLTSQLLADPQNVCQEVQAARV